MLLFYKTFLQPILCFNYLCWFSSLTVQNKDRLSRIVTIAEKIISTSLDNLNVLFGKQTIKKVQKILRDDCHVLQPCYKYLPSGKRLRSMPGRTNRTKNSFVNTSIRLFNKLWFPICTTSLYNVSQISITDNKVLSIYLSIYLLYAERQLSRVVVDLCVMRQSLYLNWSVACRRAIPKARFPI